MNLSTKILARISKVPYGYFVRHKSLIKPSSQYEAKENTRVSVSTKVDSHYWEEIRVPVPWGHVAGKAWGNKNGLPVLGIHGFLDNAGTFDTIAPLLLDSLYFVTLDLPGHGLSSHLPTGTSYNILQYLLTLRRVVRHMKWDTFSLIGHSYGAGLGAAYSGIYPKEVAKLVLLDFTKIVTNPEDATYPQNLANGFDFFLDMEAKTEREDSPLYTYNDAVMRLIRGTKNQLTEESAKICMIRGATHIGSEDRWQFNRDVLVNALRVFRFTHESIFQIHSQIRCPVLLLQPKNGMVMESKEVLDKCLKIFQDNTSSFEIIETGQGHFFHLNEPEEPAKFINKFFLGS